MPDSLVEGQRLREAHAVTSRSGASATSSAPQWRMTAAEISRRGAVGLEEVIRTFAGISVKDYGGIGGLKTVSLRNFGSQHTAFCCDGIVMSNAQNGQVDIGGMNLHRVAEVKVDVGGSDDLLRPARLAGYVGAVSILTKAPTDSFGTHAAATLRYGSFATVMPTAHVQWRTNHRWAYDVSASGIHSESDYPFRLTNGKTVSHERRKGSQVTTATAECNAWGNLQQAGTLHLKASATAASRGLPGSVVLYTQHPTEHLWDRTAMVSALHRFSRRQWDVVSSASYHLLWNRYTDTNAIYREPLDDHYLLQQAALSTVARWHVSRAWALSIAEDVEISHLDANIPECAYPTRESSYTALSGQYATPRLTATATFLTLFSTEQTRGSTAAAPTRLHLSPSASVSWQVLPSADWRLRASLRDGYRLPTFNDLYYSRVGNRNLHPERAWQSNVGTTLQRTWGSNSLRLTADGYYNRVRNKIVAVPTMFIWSMRNVGRVDMLGADFSAAYSCPLPHAMALQISANYSLQHAIDVTDRTAKNYRHQIAYAPRHTGSASLGLQLPWFHINYSLTAVGERYSLAQNLPAYRMAHYADHSIALSRTFRLRRVQLHASAEALNLAGTNYEVIKYYPMPGRQFRVALSIDY